MYLVFLIFVNVTSYLGLGLMAARTSILKLGEAVKDGKASWIVRDLGLLFVFNLQYNAVLYMASILNI